MHAIFENQPKAGILTQLIWTSNFQGSLDLLNAFAMLISNILICLLNKINYWSHVHF